MGKIAQESVLEMNLRIGEAKTTIRTERERERHKEYLLFIDATVTK